jgi:tetraacyldisaccharide 4'-kinase
VRDASAQFRRMWSGERRPGTILLAGLTTPLAVLFGVGVRGRTFLYDRKLLDARRAPIPVVSIGNLAVGGTGKTPVSAWLVRRLSELGWRPAVVRRGYGEDEVLLHRRWNPEIPVICERRRFDGVVQAADAGRDLAVLDDGFQHRALHRDLDVVLCSPAHRRPPRLLPRGPYREPLRAIRRADQVLVTTKGPDEEGLAHAFVEELRRLPGAPPVDLFPFRYGDWQDLSGRPADRPPGVPLVVTSVAEPTAFVARVCEEAGGMIRHLEHPDHHPYGEADVRRIAGLAGRGWIATTEKDAVKLEPFRELLPEARVLPLVPDPDPGVLNRLVDRIGPRPRRMESR